MFDEPFEEVLSEADFTDWLTNIKNELVKENVTESKENRTEIQDCTQQSD